MSAYHGHHGQPEPRRLNVAVIGAAEWAAAYHLPALKLLEEQSSSSLGSAPAIRLYGIWNRTTALAERAAARFGFPRVYSELGELAADERIDCFVVLVNPKVLPEIVSQLLPRQLPLFTEKSPGWSYRQARELADTVRVVNVVGFNRRYMPLNQRFKAVVEAMPTPYFVDCHFYRHERLCEEFIIETGVHGLNYLEYLCGPVAAIHTVRRKNPVNQTYLWECTMEFASGLHGAATFFPCSGSSIERFAVHGNDQSAYLHSPQTYSSDYPGRIILHRGGKVAETVEGSTEASVLVNAGFVNEYLDFFAGVLHGQDTVSNFRNACATMQMAETVERGESYRASEPRRAPKER
jgi:predicted dehydrogenase